MSFAVLALAVGLRVPWDDLFFLLTVELYIYVCKVHVSTIGFNHRIGRFMQENGRLVSSL